MTMPPIMTTTRALAPRRPALPAADVPAMSAAMPALRFTRLEAEAMARLPQGQLDRVPTMERAAALVPLGSYLPNWPGSLAMRAAVARSLVRTDAARFGASLAPLIGEATTYGLLDGLAPAQIDRLPAATRRALGVETLSFVSDDHARAGGKLLASLLRTAADPEGELAKARAAAALRTGFWHGDGEPGLLREAAAALDDAALLAIARTPGGRAALITLRDALEDPLARQRLLAAIHAGS